MWDVCPQWTCLHFRGTLAPWQSMSPRAVLNAAKLGRSTKEIKHGGVKRQCKFVQKNLVLNSIATWAWASCEEGWYHLFYRHEDLNVLVVVRHLA